MIMRREKLTLEEATARLREVFYDSETGLRGLRGLHARVKGKGITQKVVREFLRRQETSQQMHTRPGRDEHLPIKGPLGSMQADLVFMPHKKRLNHNYDVLLLTMRICV